MAGSVPIALLPVQARHAETLAQSARDRADLARRLREKRYRGVAIIGFPRDLVGTVSNLRGAGLVVGLLGAADELIERSDKLTGVGPVVAIVRGDPSGWYRHLALLRSATVRTALHDELPCWIGVHKPDVSVAVDRSAPVWQASCDACGARSRCPGPPQDAQVTPLPDTVSNQFDLLEIVGEPGPDAITIDVHARDQAVRFAVDRGEFAREDVNTALDLGQLYLDISEAARLHDFAAETRQLRRDPDGWGVVAGDPFAAEEAALIKLLANLRGRVVDVGAGPVRYVRALNEAIAAGTLSYLAVEPDPDHLDAAVTAMPAGQFVRGVGEALPVADASADAVLMLRSWNHLVDPDAAVSEAARVVAPGGLLIAVDNVLFGLCRSTEQLQRARAIPVTETPFEHLRNANGDEAAAVVAANPAWSVERVEPVTARTANQWLLVAHRVGR